MSSCLETFGAVGQWVVNLLNCVEPCLNYRVAELIISIVSVILGLVDVITDWINWNSWKENPELLEQDYYTKLLKYITIFGTMLFVCEIIILLLKLCFWCIPDNGVHPFNEDDSHSQFMYAPYEFKGSIYLLWDISTVLAGAIEDLPVMVFAYNLATATECKFAEAQVRSEATVAAIAASVVNSIWLLCVSLFKAIWTCTIPGPTRQLTEPDEDDHALCRFACTLWAPIFMLGFLLTFLIPCYSMIDSVFIHTVNGLLIFDIVILYVFHVWFYLWYPRIMAVGMGVTNCIVFFIVIVVGSVTLQRLTVAIDTDSLLLQTTTLPCLLHDPKL